MQKQEITRTTGLIIHKHLIRQTGGTYEEMAKKNFRNTRQSQQSTESYTQFDEAQSPCSPKKIKRGTFEINSDNSDDID